MLERDVLLSHKFKRDELVVVQVAWFTRSLEERLVSQGQDQMVSDFYELGQNNHASREGLIISAPAAPGDGNVPPVGICCLGQVSVDELQALIVDGEGGCT